MADTGEAREIKVRTEAKEAEVVAESKKLLQKSMAAADKALSKRRGSGGTVRRSIDGPSGRWRRGRRHRTRPAD